MFRYKIIVLIMFLGIFANVQSQYYLSSPYSRYAMGDMMSRASAATLSMGGIGYAFQASTVVNFSNPASYVAFDTLSCLVDASLSLRTHTLRSGTQTQKGTTVFVDYLSLGLPIQKWWKTAFGFQPYSNMTYTVETSDSLAELGAYKHFFDGDGGLNEVYWGNAFKLYKGLSVGLNASFLFGKYTRSRSAEFEADQVFNSIIESSNRVLAANLVAGIQYFAKIKEAGSLGIGITYTPSLNITAKSLNLTTTYFGTTEGTSTLIDTLYYQDETKIKHKMPTVVGAGISWGKENKYHIEANVTWSNWSNYSVGGSKDTNLVDAYKFSLGGSLTPKYANSKLFARMTYNLGANFELTRLMLNNEQLKRFGINFGVFIPLKRNKTSVGIVLEYGQMGTTKNNLIKDSYLNASINLRLHERWYQRIKLD